MPHKESTQRELHTPLYVNDGPLESEDVGFLRQTTLDTPIEQIRERLHEDGYVFLKGLLPREDVLKAREEYFRFLSPSGVLKPGTAPVDGIFDSAKDRLDYPGIGAGKTDSCGEPARISAKFVDLAIEAHKQDWYKEKFCKHPDLKNFVAELTAWGKDTVGLQRTLLRNNTPGNKAIGVHYDHIFLRHGEDTFLTAWVPIGDIALDGGGLIYLENGHKLGAEIEGEFTKRAIAGGLTQEEAKYAFNQNMMSSGLLADGPKEFGKEHGRRWLITEYEAGDVVLHSSYAIHASIINHAADGAIRLGTDLRFVNSKRPWDTRWDKTYDLYDGL